MQSKKEKEDIFQWTPESNRGTFDIVSEWRHNATDEKLFQTGDGALEYLAEILLEAYLENKKHAGKR